ncbi:MFS transporter [Litoribrevibacter albus]|uniref:MFS transporter n=1 Tax=Litoribrevibacter albus TaxID=1473156 RepID=A0AA37SFQ6_9GAMM|nr:MFS transporter [Litoribrevibacter albus]GLQ33349.1 MFS transporter [Litoribrevibacter albus]
MKVQTFPLIALAILALIPQGITGEIYSTGALEIAGTLGLSADEATWLKTLNMFGQLASFPLAAWLAYRIGNRNLFRLGAGIGLLSALVSSLWMNPAPQMIAWLGHGISASFLLLCAHRMVLTNLSFRTIALVEGGMLLCVVLIPLSLYPIILAQLAENNLWHWSFAVQVVPFLMMLYWGRFGRWPCPDQRQAIRFNGLQAVLLSSAICGITYLLLRGERFNWFRDPQIVFLSLLTLVLLVLAIMAIHRHWGTGEYIRCNALASPHGKVGMIDAAVAGFVIMGTTILVSVYVTQVMHYSHEQLGELEVIGFGGMLAGLMIALWVTSSPARNPESVIPLGVGIMLLACWLLTGSNAYSGAADLWTAILLKGLAVGILNITLTVHILRSFPRDQAAEGIAWFYLFRNLGSMLAITEFSRLMCIETANSVSRLAENYNVISETFSLHQERVGAMLQQSVISPSAEQAAALMGGHLQTQAMSVAGINNFQWIIFSIGILVPIMAAVMKWARSHNHHNEDQIKAIETT